MKIRHLGSADQDMLLSLGIRDSGKDVAGMLEHDVRRGLCMEMAALGQGTKRLLALLERQGAIDGLPDGAQAEYRAIMRQISAAALEGQVLFMRSRALDKEMLFAAMPGEGRIQ